MTSNNRTSTLQENPPKIIQINVYLYNTPNPQTDMPSGSVKEIRQLNKLFKFL